MTPALFKINSRQEKFNIIFNSSKIKNKSIKKLKIIGNAISIKFSACINKGPYGTAD